MRFISCKLEDLRKIVLPIGYEGENEHTRVQVDAGEVFAQYPAAVPSLKVHAPGGSIYPAEVTRNGKNVIWDIKASDCAADGNGEAQFTFTNNNVIVKSCIAKIKVHRSIVGGSTPPDPVQDWIDAADEVLDDLEAMDNIAKNAEAGDVGKALSPKTVEDGVVTEWQYIEPGGGTEDYTDLENKPQIGGVTLTGDLSLHDLGIAAESAIPDVSGKANLSVIAPAFVQGTANDAGSLVTYTDGVVYVLPEGHTAGTTWANTTKTATNIGAQLGNVLSGIEGKYTKPSGGIPDTDLSSGVQTSLGLADTAYQKPSGGIPATDIASGVIPAAHNVPAGGTTGQVLKKRSGNDYDAGWVNESIATDAQVADAVENWLDANVPTGTTVVVDASLSISGAAADAAKVGGLKDKVSELEEFCKKEVNEITTGSINVTSGSTVEITQHLVDINIANGTEYKFKINANGNLTKYHLYVNGSVLQYNCVPETEYSFTAGTDITYFSIYCSTDIVVGTGSITGVVTIPTETTNSLEERVESLEDDIGGIAIINSTMTGKKVLNTSDIRNSYVEGNIGEQITYRSTTASKCITDIIKVKSGSSYTVKVTYGSEISSSSTRGNYVVNDNGVVLQNFGMGATASTTVTTQFTASGDGNLILVVDSGYISIEIDGLLGADDINAIDNKVSGDNAEGVLTDLMKARMVTSISYLLWGNTHGEYYLNGLCEAMGASGWVDVKPKTDINSSTGIPMVSEVYRQASDFIDVTGAVSIESELSDTLQYQIYYAIRCYDSNKDFIGTAESDSGTTSSLNGNVKRNLVTDTKYIRLLLTPSVSSPTQNLAGIYTGRMLKIDSLNSSDERTSKRYILREVEEFKNDL